MYTRCETKVNILSVSAYLFSIVSSSPDSHPNLSYFLCLFFISGQWWHVRLGKIEMILSFFLTEHTLKIRYHMASKGKINFYTIVCKIQLNIVSKVAYWIASEQSNHFLHKWAKYKIMQLYLLIAYYEYNVFTQSQT